jgi:hypothetical protein
MVALPLADGRVRVFVREACHESECGDRSRIGALTFGAGSLPLATEHAWRPAGDALKPLGLSLVRGTRPGDGSLYVLDKVVPPRIWRLPIEAGVIKDAGADPLRPWADELGDLFAVANDLQAVGDTVYVTRYDFSGFLPGWVGSWPGVVRVTQSGESTAYAEGLRGANGIVDLGEGRELLVSDYWNRRLRLVSKHAVLAGPPRFATAKLPIHPDNLTVDGDRVLIAGQRSVLMTGLNLLAPFAPSPSAVLAIRVDQLGPDAIPEVLWSGGRQHGRSVSVAVRVPGGLALGQIRTPGVLVVRCAGAP